METIVCFMPPSSSHLHLGSARTALLGWLLAKKNKGKFLLNYSKESEPLGQQQYNTFYHLNWLGISNDSGPYYQYHNDIKYNQAIDVLLQKGLAYFDYSRKIDHTWEKKNALEKGESFYYSRRYMADTAEKQKSFEFHMRPQAIRLKMPRDRSFIVPDIIRGNRKSARFYHDIILKKPDGSYTYEFRQAVDYVTYKVTHVIREEDQEIFTPQQAFICEGLGHEVPQFGHVSFIAEPNGNKKFNRRKLRKYRSDPYFRTLHDYCLHAMKFMGIKIEHSHNPMFIDFYRHSGFLPSAILNYLIFMGDTPKGVENYMTIDEMVDSFDISWAKLKNRSFNLKKIMQFQKHHINQMTVAEKCKFYHYYLRSAKLTNWWPVFHNNRFSHLSLDPPQDLIDIVSSFGSKFRIGSDLVNLAV